MILAGTDPEGTEHRRSGAHQPADAPAAGELPGDAVAGAVAEPTDDAR